jgi:hypothetical protein
MGAAIVLDQRLNGSAPPVEAMCLRSIAGSENCPNSIIAVETILLETS